jgi:hypothetical protein
VVGVRTGVLVLALLALALVGGMLGLASAPWWVVIPVLTLLYVVAFGVARGAGRG